MVDKKGCLLKILVFTLFLLIHTLVVNASFQASDSQAVKALIDPYVYIVSYIPGMVGEDPNNPTCYNQPLLTLTELDKPYYDGKNNFDRKSPFSNEEITIYAVLRAPTMEVGGQPRYFIDSTETFKCVKFKGVNIEYPSEVEYPLEVWDNSWGTPTFKWYYFEPKYKKYYVGDKEKSFKIEFKLTDLNQWLYGWSTTKTFNVGTKRYLVELELDGQKYYSPESFGEWLKNKGYTISQLTQLTQKEPYPIPSSLAFEAHRISVKDKQFTHPLLQWASSYINVNYIYGSENNDVFYYKGTECGDLIAGALTQNKGEIVFKPEGSNCKTLIDKTESVHQCNSDGSSGNDPDYDLAKPGDIVIQRGHCWFYAGKFNGIHKSLESRGGGASGPRKVGFFSAPRCPGYNELKNGKPMLGEIRRFKDLSILTSSGTITPSESKTHLMLVDTSVSEATAELWWFGSDLDLSLIAPNGTVINEFNVGNFSNIVFDANFTDEGGNPYRSDNFESFIITNPGPGNWTLNVTAVDVPAGGENYTISIFFDSNLTLNLITDKEQYDINNTIILQANLTNGSGGVPGATVIAEIENPNSTAVNITLYDDGTHGDSTANDGLYTNSFSNTSLEGVYSIDITADGTNSGYEFIRKLQSSREVFPQTASLNNSYSDNAIDSNGNDFYDYLTVNVGVNITQAGNYKISGWLYFNESFIVAASNYTSLNASSYNIKLNFDGVAIYKSKINGPYSLNVVIYDEQERELDYGYSIYNTSSYNYIQFERPVVELNGTYSHYTNDTDSDGFYDYLVVEIEMNVSAAGNYTVKAWLEDVNDSFITEASNYSYFDVGLQTKQIKFDGLSIYQAEINGTYILSVEVYDSNYSLIDYAYDAYNTSSYNYTQFQPPGALLSDSYSDYGKDTDGNGLYDYLVIEVGVNVSKAGNYSLYGWILDVNENGTERASNFTYLNTGSNTIALNFDGLELYKYKKDGPYKLDHLVLYNAEDRGLDSRESMFDNTTNSTLYIYNTSAYIYNQFQKPVIDFINYTDYGEDTDGNGLYEYLIIEAGVNITKAGNYILLAHPIHNTANYTLSDIIYAFLDMNNKTIKFRFNGEAIGNFKQDGIFTLNQIIVYNSTGSIVNHLINNLYNTSLYNYTQFDTSPTGSTFTLLHGGVNITIFDSAGNLFLKNTLTQSTIPTDTTDDEFLLKNDSGTVVAKINSTGYMEIKGTLSQNQGTLVNPSGNDFLIKDDSLNVVAYINESGFMFLKGSLYENSIS